MLHLKLLLGFSGAAGGTRHTLCRDKMLFLQKDVLGKDLVLTHGKLFTQQAERLKLNLAAGRKK